MFGCICLAALLFMWCQICYLSICEDSKAPMKLAVFIFLKFVRFYSPEFHLFHFKYMYETKMCVIMELMKAV